MPAPANGFNIFAGTSGAVRTALITPTAGFDVVPYPSPVPARTVVLEAAKWNIEPQIEHSTFVGFQNSADSNGLIGKLLLKGGIVSWKVTIEGAVNGDSLAGAASHARFPLGGYICFDILFQKETLYGYIALMGKVVKVGSGNEAESNKPTPLTVEIEGQGALSAPSWAAS